MIAGIHIVVDWRIVGIRIFFVDGVQLFQILQCFGKIVCLYIIIGIAARQIEVIGQTWFFMVKRLQIGKIFFDICHLPVFEFAQDQMKHACLKIWNTCRNFLHYFQGFLIRLYSRPGISRTLVGVCKGTQCQCRSERIIYSFGLLIHWVGVVDCQTDISFCN